MKYKRYIKTFESFFNKTIPSDSKRMSNRYEGRNIIWYGSSDQMIYIHKDYVDTMFGNIYYPDKLDQLTKLIENSDEKIEIECSYAVGTVIDFNDLLDEQESVYLDRFDIDYSNKEHPASTGDEELDNYIGCEYLGECGIMSYVTYDTEELNQFLSDNKFFMVQGKKDKDWLLREINNRFDNLSDLDIEYYTEFIEVEEQLKESVDNQEGDVGTFRVELRDAHHRVRAAIDSGETYICVNLVKEDLILFKDYIQRLPYVGRVSNK